MSLWKLLTARWGSNAGETDEVRIDGATNTLQTIEYEHHEIHGGTHFYICDFETLNSGATADFAVTTPAGSKWSHMIFEVNGTSQTEMRIYEGATVSGGTSTTPLNNDRNSDTASVLTVSKNPSVSVAGTVIYAQSKGLGGATPNAADREGFVQRRS